MLPSVLDTKTFSLVLSAWFVSYGSGIYRLKKSCQKNLNGYETGKFCRKFFNQKIYIQPVQCIDEYSFTYESLSRKNSKAELRQMQK